MPEVQGYSKLVLLVLLFTLQISRQSFTFKDHTHKSNPSVLNLLSPPVKNVSLNPKHELSPQNKSTKYSYFKLSYDRSILHLQQ